MPAPLAKGLVITVSILVAAGIAVYESPQIQEWIKHSRRKIALAIQNIEDDLNNRRRGSEPRDDISMTEDLGAAAEERRKRALEEIMLRRSILEAQKQESPPATSSFDTLVDDKGRLKQTQDISQTEEGEASTTGVEVSGSGLVRRYPNSNSGLSQSMSDIAPKINAEERRAILESIDRNRPRTRDQSETSSNHPSESLVDLTPTTSEFSGTHPGSPARSLPDEMSDDHLTQSDYLSVASSRMSMNSDHDEPEYYYAHPDHHAENPFEPERQPLSDVHGHQPSNGFNGDLSSTPSIVSSNLSHIQHETFDATSDGTLSDLGNPREGIYTPVSWSEVGSVISSNDGSHS